MPGFCMECYSQVKWVKQEHSISQVLNLSLPNVPKEVLLTVLKIQAKTPSHSGGSVLGERAVVCPHSNGERLRDIQHSKSMVLDTRFHIFNSYYKIRCLLQIATVQSAIGDKIYETIASNLV